MTIGRKSFVSASSFLSAPVRLCHGTGVASVSIARDGERDKVITRFAVVRRERVVARWL